MATVSSLPPSDFQRATQSNRSRAMWQQHPVQTPSMLCLATTLSYASVSSSVKECCFKIRRLLSLCEKQGLQTPTMLGQAMSPKVRIGINTPENDSPQFPGKNETIQSPSVALSYCDLLRAL